MNSSDAPARLRPALISNATDALGSQLLALTIDLLAVASLGFTATQVGLLNALGTISYLLLAVPLGLLVDARGPLKVLTATLTIKMIIAAGTLGLLATGHLDVAAAMLLALTFGVASVASETAQTTLVPHLSDDPEAITHTVARMASADQMASIACPALVGLGIAHHAGRELLTGSAVLLVGALLCLTRIHAPTPTNTPPSNTPPARSPRTQHGKRPAGTELGEGFRTIATTPNLLGVTALVTAGNIGLAIGDSVEAILVLRHLHLGSSFYGLLTSIGAIAGFAASLVTPRLIGTGSLVRVFAIGGLAQAIVAALPLLTLQTPALARPALITFSIGWALVMTVCNIAAAAYTATNVPKQALGRATAASRTITMGSIPMAALAGGVLADHLGIAAPLTIWPLLTLLAALTFLLLTRHPHH